MKKILITGASGTIGILVLKKLINLNKYEITALDLKSSKSIKRFKPYKKEVNLVYGDINNEVLISSLIKDHDIVIHLAGIIPPFANIKENLSRIVDYEGTKNIINAINNHNPKCFLLFASSTTLYGERNDEIKVTDKPKINPDDSYSLVKLRCEEQITRKLKNYSIFRLPAILGNPKTDAPMYNIPIRSKIEFITKEDAARAFVNAIEKQTKINKKIFNVAGGKKYRISYMDYQKRILKVHGLSIRFLGTLFLVDKNFYSGYYSDSDESEKILKYRSGSIEDYFKTLKKRTSTLKRIIPILLAKIFLLFMKFRKVK